MSSYAKNIKRNATRPTASRRPYTQSIYRSKETAKEIREAKERQELDKKLKSWKNIS